MLTIGAPTVNSSKIPKIKHLDYRLESDISAPTIKVAKSQKALEMVFDCDLKFNSHIVEVKKVIPPFPSFSYLVRPHLQYASSVWNLQLVKLSTTIQTQRVCWKT